MRPERILPCVLVAAGLAFACVPTPAPETPPPETTPPPPPPSLDEGNTTQIDCGGGTLPITVSATIPNAPVFASGPVTLASIQCGFDVFSWNSFLAVNHSPSGGFGDLDGDNPAVWESWPAASDVFLADGDRPPPWPDGEPPPPHRVPPECESMLEPGMKVLSQLGKNPDVLEATDQPFNSGPLIDTHGYYSRFEITVNRDMYTYILDNRLFSREGQAAFADDGQTVNFTCGCPAGASCAPGGQQGAIMVKAAWKILELEGPDPDDPAHFHKALALVLTPAEDGGSPTCNKQLVGLVGLHIGHKTQDEPQWTWSTFEHVANAPTQGAPVQPGARFNYNEPDCDACRVNVPPPQPWNPQDEPVTDPLLRSQVVRAIPIDEPTRAMNTAAQGLVPGTVWRFYELVSTQWPTNGSGASPGKPSAENGWCAPLNQVDKAGVPAPAFLANTTLETYIQGTVPQASSSCINCHLNAATTAPADDNFSDFTYLLERAQ